MASHNLYVRLHNRNGVFVKAWRVKTRPEQTFDYVMRKFCRRIEREFDDYDVVSGSVLLNDWVIPMSGFNIPAEHRLEVDMREKWIDNAF
jgi:hypothetical protein